MLDKHKRIAKDIIDHAHQYGNRFSRSSIIGLLG